MCVVRVGWQLSGPRTPLRQPIIGVMTRLPLRDRIVDHAATVVELAALTAGFRRDSAPEPGSAARTGDYDRRMTTGPRYVVIGGGIVGLAVADLLASARPGSEVTVLEKERDCATHQTGRNSGVIHSGLYYAPGSKKALMCRAGARSMVRFAEEEGVAHETCGKLVVATSESQLPGLRSLQERGLANGLTVSWLSDAEAREHEPHVRAVAALHVPSTGIIDYGAVCRALVRRLRAAGATMALGSEVVGATASGRRLVVHTTTGDIPADVVVNCAGLQSDLVARRLGTRPTARIVPFRGEYYSLRADRSHLVQNLIYPVPDPRFPFLGVHLTRGVDGAVHAGPNAVLAFAREGYRWDRIAARELADTLGFPGFWRLAAGNYRRGASEVMRSVSRHLFGNSLRRLVPAIRDEDLVPAPAGVRAQALNRDGSLVDDFLLEQQDNVIHVLNAPSPAATSAFEIARHVVSLMP
jgi:(S)-2-hydroxyglutarate dehydrogenase